MKKRATVHSFDLALGLVWLTIIFVGIIYLLTGRISPSSSPIDAVPLGHDAKMELMRSMQQGSPVPSEEERLRVVSELSQTTSVDDRSSVYTGSEPEASHDEKLRTLEALRSAR